MKHGFVKVAAAVPFVRVADCIYNIERIEAMVLEAESKGVEIITFPELCLSQATPVAISSSNPSSSNKLSRHSFGSQSVQRTPRY